MESAVCKIFKNRTTKFFVTYILKLIVIYGGYTMFFCPNLFYYKIPLTNFNFIRVCKNLTDIGLF